jgi:hypothetical protein
LLNSTSNQQYLHQSQAFLNHDFLGTVTRSPAYKNPYLSVFLATDTATTPLNRPLSTLRQSCYFESNKSNPVPVVPVPVTSPINSFDSICEYEGYCVVHSCDNHQVSNNFPYGMCLQADLVVVATSEVIRFRKHLDYSQYNKNHLLSAVSLIDCKASLQSTIRLPLVSPPCRLCPYSCKKYHTLHSRNSVSRPH